MEETQVKDETGTVAPMTRSQIESEIAKKLNEQAAPLLDKIENPDTKAKAADALKQLTAMMAMANMWVNAVISDVAATTVFTFQQTYDWKGFMEYQAAHNAEVAKRIEAMQDMMNRTEHKVGMLVQEWKKTQPDHTKPPKVL